jgi:tetratricopeptide (TPR) repeat protein
VVTLWKNLKELNKNTSIPLIMKMQANPVILSLLISASFFLVSCKTQPNGNEIQITTTSKEALKLFIDGRDKFENIEFISAASLFDLATQKDSNFAMAYLYRSLSGGESEIFRQNLNKAVNLIDKVSDGEKSEIRYFLAKANGDGQKQKKYLDQLLLSFPSDKRVQMIAGEYYYNLKDYSTALVYYNKSAEIDKDFAPPYNRIGYCQSELKNYEEAEKAFLTYKRLLPDKANPYDSYAGFLLETGEFDESIEQYKKAFELDPPNFANSLLWIGNNYIFKGDYESARKYYRNYFDQATLTNGKLSALYLIGTSYVHEGKTENALKFFDEFRHLAEEENLPTMVVLSYIDEASILRSSGNPSEGLKYSEKAIDLAEKLPATDQNRELMITITTTINFDILAANNELDKAIVEAEKCRIMVESRKNPAEERQLNSFLARLEIRKGNYDMAIEYFDKGGREDPQNWFYNAVAYKAKGENQKALELFEKIKECHVNGLSLAFARKLVMEELK